MSLQYMIIKLFLWDYGRSRILLLLRPLAIKCPEIWLWIILQGPRLMIRVQKADLKVLRKFWHEVFVHLLMICYSLLCIPHLTLVPGHCHSCAQVWRFRSRWDHLPYFFFSLSWNIWSKKRYYISSLSGICRSNTHTKTLIVTSREPSFNNI